MAKIEAGKRGLSLDEAITIAWALGLPPALLYLPLGEADDISLAPDVVVHPDLARKWIKGDHPATTSDRYVRMPGEWKSDMAVWWWHDGLNKASDAAHKAKAAIQSAEYVGNTSRIEEARSDDIAALRELAGELEEMRGHGWVVPAIHSQRAADMQAAGIDYDGPIDSEEEK